MIPSEFYEVVGTWGPAVLVAIAVGIAVVRVSDSLRRRTNSAVIASMPKYTSRALHSAAEDGQQIGVDETSLFLRLGRKVLAGRYHDYLVGRMKSAGVWGNSALSAMIIRKVTYGLIGAVVGIVFIQQGFANWIMGTLVLMVLGFFVPDILLVQAADKREAELEKELPDAIDLLNLCVDAGLSFENAISRVSLSLNGPAAQEFGALISEIQLGKSRIEAMTAVADRTHSEDFQRFLASLLQVDRLGVPISSVIAEQAQVMRNSRRDKAREAGQKVTIKILAPLMVCFMPAMFIIVIGPAIVDLVKGLGALGG